MLNNLCKIEELHSLAIDYIDFYPGSALKLNGALEYWATGGDCPLALANLNNFLYFPICSTTTFKSIYEKKMFKILKKIKKSLTKMEQSICNIFIFKNLSVSKLVYLYRNEYLSSEPTHF